MAHFKTETVTTDKPPIWLASERGLVRKTYGLSVSLATTKSDGTKVIVSGTPYPANDDTAIGLVYGNYPVTDEKVGETIEGSVMLAGRYYENYLPVTLAAAATGKSSAKDALKAHGLFADAEPTVTR